MNPPATPAKPASNRWKAVLILLLVFALGAATGVGGALFYVRSQMRFAVVRPLSGRDRLDRLAARVESNLSKSLKLNAQERSAVHGELAVSVEKARQLRTRMFLEVRALVADTLARIGNRLPPEKQAKLKKKAADRLSRWGFNLEEPKPVDQKK